MNENENTTTQNLWDTVKAVLRGKFTSASRQKQTNSKELSISVCMKKRSSRLQAEQTAQPARISATTLWKPSQLFN